MNKPNSKLQISHLLKFLLYIINYKKTMTFKIKSYAFVFVYLVLIIDIESAEVQIKDLVRFQEERLNQVTGFGLVVGLNNSGDTKSPFTEQALSNYLNSLGVDTRIRLKETRNIASVMVTASIPSYSKRGDRIDVLVSSIGDARSLDGGVLIQSPLKSASGEVIAVASGSLQSQDNESKNNQKGYSKRKKSTNTAMIIHGGIVEKELNQLPLDSQRDITSDTPSSNDKIIQDQSIQIRLVLNNPSLTTINAIITKINSVYPEKDLNPTAINSREIELSIPKEKNLLGMISEIESMKIDVNIPSKVVINLKTGTIIIGGNLSLDEVAVSKIGLKKQLDSRGKSRYFWSDVEDRSESVFYIKKISNVKSLVEELNRLGAGTEDVISILQSLNRSGILNAEVIVE